MKVQVRQVKKAPKTESLVNQEDLEYGKIYYLREGNDEYKDEIFVRVYNTQGKDVRIMLLSNGSKTWSSTKYIFKQVPTDKEVVLQNGS